MTFLRIIAEMIRVKAAQKGLAFTFEAAPDLPRRVWVDDARLRQVLLNLLSNAVKFTDRGKVSLRVQSLPGGGPQVQLRFEAGDTGVGISQVQREIIFQPFEQVGDLTRRAGGTGLGLAISRQLVRLMSSEIQFESAPGIGSRFWFDLSVPVAAEVTAGREEQAIAGYRGARRKLLIVDDVEANRLMLVELLEPLGFEVRTAADGQEALDQVLATPPDLIVMDLMMPVLDGLEATRRIRRTPSLRQVPIIAVSASASQDDRAKSLAAGANVFLAKPIAQDSLLEQIGTHLGLSWVYEQPEEQAISQEEGAGPFVVPPHAEMEILHHLALVGNMSDIWQRADHLAALDAQYRPFADRLRDLAKHYESKAVLGLVEDNLNEDKWRTK